MNPKIVKYVSLFLAIIMIIGFLSVLIYI